MPWQTCRILAIHAQANGDKSLDRVCAQLAGAQSRKRIRHAQDRGFTMIRQG
jgi:hypothetical protein